MAYCRGSWGQTSGECQKRRKERWGGASFLRFFVRHSVIQTLTMGNKGPDLVLKQGNDRNQISLFRNREKNRAGTEGPLAAPNLPSPPRLPAPPWPFRPKQPTSGGPPAPIRVPDHTLGPPRETESAVGPEYPLGKSSSRATEKAPDKLLGKCQQEGGPDISGAPSPALSSSVCVANFWALPRAESKELLGMCMGGTWQGLLGA